MKKLALLLLAFVLSLSAHAKVKVACVGDSVTYGATLPDRENECYPARLQAMLGDDYEVRNFGRNGSTLLSKGHNPYVKSEEYEQALAFNADIVVIHLGLNDTDPRNWPVWGDEFIPDYLALIESFRQVNPAVKVWICRMTPITHVHRRFLSGTRVWHEAVQRQIERVAVAAGVALIDLESPLFVRPEIFRDSVHPDPEGARIIASTVFSAVTGNYGGLELPSYYGDDMVLQRGREIRVCGTADTGTDVRVRLNGAGHSLAGSCTAGPDGKWSVTLPPLPAGGPYTLRIADRKFEGVWIGEVWICAGQSNMAFTLSESDTVREDIASSSDSRLHFYAMKPKHSLDDEEWPEEELSEVNRLDYYAPASWELSSAATAASFSAVGYHFAKTLADSLGCHIGVVDCSVGGSTTESWCAPELLRSDYPQILRDWYHGDFGQAWARDRALKNIAKAPKTDFQRHPFQPGYLFDAALRPFGDYGIRGILWYQGESNAHCAETHEDLFRLAVRGWRNLLGEETPVETIQLSGIGTRPEWPAFRNSQRLLAESIEGVGMTVCSDLGHPTDVHPKSKRPVGRRAARSALHNVYGFDIVPSGPVYRGLDIEGASLRLYFDYADGLKCSSGFEVAGADGVFHVASMAVEDRSVVVSSPEVPHPCAVRYAWTPNPADADLVNASGLPCSTFRDETGRP